MTKKVPGAKRGRPAHKVTEHLRGEVRGLVVAGFPAVEIAKHVRISEDTLLRYYKYELENSSRDLLKSAATSLGFLVRGRAAIYDKKGNLLHAEIPIQPGMVAFSLKTRGKRFGWSERIELSGPEGGAIVTKDETKNAVVAEMAGLIAERLSTQETEAEED